MELEIVDLIGSSDEELKAIQARIGSALEGRMQSAALSKPAIITEHVIPTVGDILEVTVTKWLIEVGGRVTAGEPLLEVSTDKVDLEVPARDTGILRSIECLEGSTVGIGAVVCTIEVPYAAL